MPSILRTAILERPRFPLDLTCDSRVVWIVWAPPRGFSTVRETMKPRVLSWLTGPVAVPWWPSRLGEGEWSKNFISDLASFRSRDTPGLATSSVLSLEAPLSPHVGRLICDFSAGAALDGVDGITLDLADLFEP